MTQVGLVGRRRRHGLITVDADVAGFEVGDDVLRAGLLLVKRGVGQLDHTRRSSRAARIEQRQYVGGAADIDVGVDAATESHPAELGRLHHDDVAERTAGVKRFPLAVVLYEGRAAAAAAAPGPGRCQTNTSNIYAVSKSSLQQPVTGDNPTDILTEIPIKAVSNSSPV